LVLDRMVRSQRPLQEKMTLFCTTTSPRATRTRRSCWTQNRMLRANGLGSFRTLLRKVTADPAMQNFLSLVQSHKDDPNENYARELLELFTLGVGGGYTERDVREALARSRVTCARTAKGSCCAWVSTALATTAA
jgi:uncharacterized protein (DUF1800 family)